MKFTSAVMAGALLAAAISTSAAAEDRQQQQMQNMQAEQQACEGDVYALCGEAIPDQQRIAKCLRKNWSKVSHKCRKVMASYSKRHGGDDD
jgi:hypothetical protein